MFATTTTMMCVFKIAKSAYFIDALDSLLQTINLNNLTKLLNKLQLQLKWTRNNSESINSFQWSWKKNTTENRELQIAIRIESRKSEREKNTINIKLQFSNGFPIEKQAASCG